MPDCVRLVQTGPDVSFAVEEESVSNSCSRIEQCSRNRAVRYCDVSACSVEVEKVKDIRVLPSCHEDPVRSYGGKLTEVLTAYLIANVSSRVGWIRDWIEVVRYEDTSR